jgi:hypothetical protein
LAKHGLVAGGTQVKNTEAAVAKAYLIIEVLAMCIWPTVTNGIAHGL